MKWDRNTNIRVAGGSGSDTRDTTLWFSEARSERYACGPHWGHGVLCPAAPTRGEGPQAPSRLPQACCRHPSPALQSGFSVSQWVPEDQLGNFLFFLVRPQWVVPGPRTAESESRRGRVGGRAGVSKRGKCQNLFVSPALRDRSDAFGHILTLLGDPVAGS